MSTTEQIADIFNAHVMPTYAPRLALVKGSGTKVWDADGQVYLDFAAGIAVLNVGYSHPTVVDAISRQAGVLTHVSNLYYTENQARLAQKLASISLGGKCFFCNSGAEANEALIKLARLWGHDDGKYEIICMKNSFHGRTLATAAATGQEKIQKGFEPMPEGFVHADFNNIDSVTALVNEKTVAILLEAVQGEGGVVPASPDFLKAVRELCDSKNLLMLCDEVQCGMGRTGSWFGFQTLGVKPDAFSVAKALGSGYPIGAIVSTPELADTFQPGKHASTFGGTPLACAAALATIDVIEAEGLVAEAARKGAEIKTVLNQFVEKYEHVTEARGVGLMLGLVMDQPVKPLADKLAEIGLLTIATAENVLRMLPPLNVKESEIEEALEILDECLAEMHGVSEEQDEEPEADVIEPEQAGDEAPAEEAVAEVEAVVEATETEPEPVPEITPEVTEATEVETGTDQEEPAEKSASNA